jgi:murein DD-endopeptidase MepM/ murein hydrolase activator NlpD
MNALFTAHTIWSCRKELLFVTLSFLILISLPIIAVFILTHTGINVVSDALIGIEPETQTLQIKNPTDSSQVTEITSEMTWPVSGVFTLLFGQSSAYQIFHTGIDIANPQGQVGDPIIPFMDGVVIFEGEKSWGYGKYIIVDHGNNITSLYAHLNRIYVYTGQELKIGDTIGTMGSTGWSTGPHLHFEIRVYGIPVNPRVFLNE